MSDQTPQLLANLQVAVDALKADLTVVPSPTPVTDWSGYHWVVF